MTSIQIDQESVNAALAALVTIDPDRRPLLPEPRKRRWGSCLSQYWCFGSQSKRIGHAVLVPEPTVSTSQNYDMGLIIPPPPPSTFIAPPSSPASFLQSDPQSPLGLPSGTESSSIFTIGPYAHETQLVSPPVLSAVNTEPSTAAFTPPLGSVQPTAPSSPDVPFAQLLASSLAQTRKNGKNNMNFQPYQYPGSPGNHHLISPDSAVSNSGTSSPFPEFRMGEASKFVGYDHFITRKWGSRLGSGSLTPNGLGSRLGSGTATPNGGLSRLGSGTLTPTGEDPDLQEKANQISEVESLVNSHNASQDLDVVIDHRVSFELNNNEIHTCLEKDLVGSQMIMSVGTTHKDETIAVHSGEVLEGKSKRCFHKRTFTLGSSKDFNFDNTDGEVLDKSIVDWEWWKNEKVVTNDIATSSDCWTFFPKLQSGVN